MKKLAIFVEGGSEMDFLERLIGEVAGRHRVTFDRRRIIGGTNVPKKVVTIQTDPSLGGEEFFVLLMNCHGDHQVASRIREEHASLTASGYEKILGLRDVRPDFTLAQVPKLAAGLTSTFSHALIPVQIFLSVMEFEAWVLAEVTHYARIDASLNATRVHAALGFDPAVGDLSARTNPADDLNAAYGLVGQTYDKKLGSTTLLLDYSEVYVNLTARIGNVKQLADSLDAFLTV